MIRSALAVAALAISLPAIAAEPVNNYSYAEASARLFVFDDDLHFGDHSYSGMPGIGGALSVQFMPYAFAFVSAEGYRQDEGSTELEQRGFQAGAGLAYPLSQNADLVATFAYTDQTAELCANHACLEADADGYTPGAGIRVALNEKADVLIKYERDYLETEAFGGYTDEDEYSNLILELHASDGNHGIVGGGEYQEGDAVFKLGYRYSFD